MLYNLKGPFVLLLLSSSAITSVYAQTPSPAAAADASDEIDTSDDIVVMARKRAESIQDVPVSVTAINAAGIERNFITQLDDVAALAPNVTLHFATARQHWRLISAALARAPTIPAKTSQSPSASMAFIWRRSRDRWSISSMSSRSRSFAARKARCKDEIRPEALSTLPRSARPTICPRKRRSVMDPMTNFT